MMTSETPLPKTQTILITGANRGLGLGLAQAYLHAGWHVIATARAPKKAAAFQPLSETYNERFSAVSLDVTNESDIAALPERLGNVSLDCVINNAGVSVEEDFGTWTAAGFEANLRTNTIGPALVAQALAARIKDGSSLINISSGMGSLELNLNPATGLDAYAISKAGLNFVTRRLTEKLRSRGIIVAAISPGWVRTDMGGQNASTSVKEAVQSLLQTIEGLTPEQSGCFLTESGEALPW